MQIDYEKLMNVQINYIDERCVPRRAHPGDAGADLISTASLTLNPGESHLFDTGVSVAIPHGYVGLVFNRSSQGKIKVQLNNAVGVIDAAYRGNIKVLLTNNGTAPYEVKAFDTRIAQLVIMPVSLVAFGKFVGTQEEWINTSRGTGGFGSTG